MAERIYTKRKEGVLEEELFATEDELRHWLLIIRSCSA